MKASTSAGTGPVCSVTGLSAECSISFSCTASMDAGTAAAKSPGEHSPVRSKIDFPAVQVQESTGAGQNRNRHAVL